MEQNQRIDPDPFLIGGVCLQAAAVVLQLVQIYRQDGVSKYPAKGQRSNALSKLESALDDFERALINLERTARRESENPDKEVYEASLKISVGILEFSLRGVREYHDGAAKALNKLGAVTTWIGFIISQHPDLAHELGGEILGEVGDAAGRLNQYMSNGAPIAQVLQEAKDVHRACKQAVERRLDFREN